MSEEEKLKFYLEKIELLAKENLSKENTTALQALKEAINYVSSEMTGY